MDIIDIMDAVQDLTSAEIADWIKQTIDAGLVGSANGIYSTSYAYLELSKSRKKITQLSAQKIAIDNINKMEVVQKGCTESKPESEFGFVYLLLNPLNGLYKIGRTSGLNRRLIDLQMASGTDLELVHSIFCKEHAQLEKDLHNKYKEKRIKGEWFQLVISEVNEIKNISDEVSRQVRINQIDRRA